jgi:hypothetical protein
MHLWSQRLGGTLADGGNSVVVDNNGDVVVAGYFRGTVDFGGGNLVSAGGADIFIAKYDAAGVHQWSKRFGGTGEDVARSIVSTTTGSIMATGNFTGTVDFGGGNLVSAGSSDVFVACYSNGGLHQWSRRFGGIISDEATSIGADAWDNVAVMGQFQNTMDAGGGPLTSAGNYDIFLVKYTAGGGHLWSQRFGGTGQDTPYSVAIDSQSNLIITGFFVGTSDFGGGSRVANGWDIFLAKYNSDGAHLWSVNYGGSGNDVGYSVAIDASDNVFVTGAFATTADLGGTILTAVGGTDIFVAKYDPFHALLWCRGMGSVSGDRGAAITVDDAGGAIVAGEFQTTVDFGGGPLTSAGLFDLFVARYSSGGLHRWSFRAGAATSDYAGSVFVGNAVELLLTGRFQGTINCGGGDLVSAGGEDILLARYTVDSAEPVIRFITDVGNDQGRRVRIMFSRSAWDVPMSATPVAGYELYRRDDPLPVAALPPHGSRSNLDDGWIYAGGMNAHGVADYIVDAPTDADSTILLGQHHSTFFVRAATANKFVYFDSPADSGYSLDNLPPGAPDGFTSNVGLVSWNTCAAADFDYFTVYGSPTPGFVDAVLVDYTVDTSWDLRGSGYSYAFVTATDFAGNESTPGWVKIATGVDETRRSYVLSVSNFPNPFNPRTTVSYTVPSPAAVTISVYDARGALVATLVNNPEHAAGAYRVEWDGRDDRGVVAASGVYFARIEHAGATRTKKMVLLK